MCAIVELKAGVVIPISALENVVWNNPHGYGLIVMKGTSDIKLIKNLDENGTNPKDIQELLGKYKKYHRFLHLRWKTEGEISLDNTQPFCVYDDGTTQVYFMHNGTLYDFKPQGADKRSDSRIFAEDLLVPLLAELQGNYSSDLARKIITKFWGVNGSSKGLLVSNKWVPMYINYSDWKDIKVRDENDIEVEFKASNDTYFDKVTRGFEYERREEERKAHQSVFSFQETSGTNDWPVTPLKEVNLKANISLTEELKQIFADSDLYSELGTASLANLTEQEVTYIVESSDRSISAGLIYHLSGMYDTLLKDYLGVKEAHERATKRIATMMTEQREGRVG